VLTFFESLTSLQLFLWVVACLLLVWALEALIPLVDHDYRKARHDAVNLAFLVMSMLVNLAVRVGAAGVFVWVQTDRIGLLQRIVAPTWVVVAIGIVALDFFAQYLAHWVLHRVKWMWKLHMVHHSDTKVDASTGTRHHPGDYLIREVFAIATVIVFGIPAGVYVLYRVVTVFFTYLTHANIRLPLWLDRGLAWLVVTPNLHKFHHHAERPWTDRNFGNVLSIWDRMLGTLVYDDPAKIVYGLDVTDPAKDEHIGYQLGLPLNRSIKTNY